MTDISKTKYNLYASLGSAKMRRKHGLFTVEGERSVADSLGTFQLEALLCLKGHDCDYSVDPSKVFSVSEEQMRHLTNLSTHSPVMAVYRLPDINDAENLKLPDDLYVVLDGVQDPGNLGTIVRTCHWFGVKKIFASRDTVDIYNPKTIQSTMGSLGRVEMTYCDLAELFAVNPELPVYGTLLEGKNIFHTELSKSGFIVMGNEGNGLSEKIRGLIGKPLYIPPKYNDDHSESLNVAVATAIVLAMFAR